MTIWILLLIRMWHRLVIETSWNIWGEYIVSHIRVPTWRWRQYIHPKSWYNSITLQGITYQEPAASIVKVEESYIVITQRARASENTMLSYPSTHHIPEDSNTDKYYNFLGQPTLTDGLSAGKCWPVAYLISSILFIILKIFSSDH
jgi:hypothetical protein